MIVSLIFEKNIEIKRAEKLTHFQCKKYAVFFKVYNIYLFTFTHIWQLELPLKKIFHLVFHSIIQVLSFVYLTQIKVS